MLTDECKGGLEDQEPINIEVDFAKAENVKSATVYGSLGKISVMYCLGQDAENCKYITNSDGTPKVSDNAILPHQFLWVIKSGSTRLQGLQLWMKETSSTDGFWHLTKLANHNDLTNIQPTNHITTSTYMYIS